MEWSLAARAAACCCLLAPLVAQARVPTAPGSGRIEGVVLDALGRPLAGADVWLAGSSAPHVQTNGNAEFAFDRLPRGRAAVHAHRRGLHTGGTEAEVTDASPCVFARVVLLPAADVVVSVVDERDAPVAGAEVVPSRTAISELWPDAADQRFVTGTDGRVVVADQALGHTAFLAWAPGFVLAVNEGYVGDAAEVRIRLARGDGLALRLVMSNLPAARLRTAHWQLHAMRAGSACLLPPSLVAGTFDDRGRAAVNGLSWDLESVQVVVTTADAAVHPKSVDIVPARSASPRPLEFGAVAADAADADVRGVAFDPAGRPLPGLRLACRTPGALADLDVEARTGDDGAFCFPGVTPPGGSFCLASLDPRFALNQSKGSLRETARQRRLFTGTAAAHTLFEVQCVAATEIRGRIVDERRQGVAGTGVRLVTRSTSEVRPLDIAATASDRDGMFLFAGQNGVDQAEVWIEAEGSNGRGHSEPFRMAVGAAFQVPAVVLAAPAILEGVVADADGAPLPGATLLLIADDGAAAGTTITDRDGRYRFSAGGGSYRLRCWCGPDPRGAIEALIIPLDAAVTRHLPLTRTRP
jgi:hypothetical protein